MASLTTNELRSIEKQHAQGITSTAIVDIFQRKGERFSEATLRKYVQLGLLPKSRRVGIRGKHRRSSGLYPVVIVRLISEIKKELDKGATLEGIRVSRVGLNSELQVLERATKLVADRFNEAVSAVEPKKLRPAFKKQLDLRRKNLEKEIKEFEKLAQTLGKAAGGEG